MKRDLVETVKFCFTGKVIGQLSSLVDETEPGVERALAKSVPLVLNGMLGQAGDSMAPATLLTLVREADAAEVLTQLPEVKSANWHERGTNLLLDLLGDSYRSTVNQIAVDASIRPTASGTLLQVAATAVLGVLGKFAVENELTPSEFVHWLQSHKDAIGAAMLPAASARGLVTQPPADSQPPAAVPPRMATSPVRMPRDEPAYAAPAAPRGLTRLQGWQWGLLLLVAVGMGYFFGRDYINRPALPTEKTAADAVPAVEPIATETTTPPPAAATAVAPVAAPAPSTPAPAPKPATLAPASKPTATRPAAALASAPAPGAVPAGGRYDINRDTYIYDTGRPILLTLADGSRQKVGANSTENRLYTFLATAAVQVDSVNRTKGWINFDRVYFEPGQATLTPESMPQLRNIASILKTFPNSVVKIGGYTDSTGVGLRNLELSEERARTAMMALANLGVGVDRLQAKGYGAKYFVSPNNTPASRSLNRRVSVRVVKK